MPPAAPREPTQPLPQPGARRARPAPEGDRRLWIVAGILALVLAFVAGYLVGRGGAEPAPAEQANAVEDGATTVRKRACVKAVAAGRRAQKVQARALANRAALAEATARGDEEVIARLNAELSTLGDRFEKVEARFEKLAERCGA